MQLLDENQKAPKELERFIKNTSSLHQYFESSFGHNYFMNIKVSDLDFVLKYKTKPLLEEYFYGDEEKFQEALALLEFDK